MGPPKGSHNARRFHEEAVGRVRERLATTLEALARTGVVFKNISALAEHVAPRCDHTAGNLRNL